MNKPSKVVIALGIAAGAAGRPMKRSLLALGALALFAGCATPPPSGPSVMVLPGSGKSFDQFRFDDNECRQFATAQIGGTSNAQAAPATGAATAAAKAQLKNWGLSLRTVPKFFTAAASRFRVGTLGVETPC